MANPMTILSFTAVFAGFLGGRGGDYGSAAGLVAGVFAGSALWWLLLSGAVGWFGRRLGLGEDGAATDGERSRRLLLWINRLSGPCSSALAWPSSGGCASQGGLPREARECRRATP